MAFRILAINPGSTSTKIALYEDELELFCQNVEHSVQQLSEFSKLTDQFEMRKNVVLEALENHGYDAKTLSAVVGRGGMLPPVKAGGYLVNQCMKDRIINGPIIAHASNLGALIASSIAEPYNIPSYIYDAVSSDELYEVAKVTGIPEIVRQSFCHVLNSKAIARKVAERLGKRYNEMNFVIAHLGGGISISAHEKGHIVDVITDDAGPFSPERSGSIPLLNIVDICYSGEYSKSEMQKKLRGMGGVKAHLGTHDLREVEKMMAAGNEKADLIFRAQAYQISKGIGELAPVLKGNIDAIILTGGVAHSKSLTQMIAERVSFIAPVEIMPGENELESLSYGVLRILRGEESANEYVEREI